MKAYRLWRARRLSRKASAILQSLDYAMQHAGMTRAERRQTWRAVVANRMDPHDLISRG